MPNQFEIPKEVEVAVKRFCKLPKETRHKSTQSAAQVQYHVVEFIQDLLKDGRRKATVEKIIEKLFVDKGISIEEIAPFVQGAIKIAVHNNEVAAWIATNCPPQKRWTKKQ